jgi:hypothetical protein
MALVAAVALISGCSSGDKAERKQTAAAAAPKKEAKGQEMKEDIKIEYKMSGVPFDLGGKPVLVAGITFTPATQWKDLGADGLRKAEYRYGPLEKDADSATVYVHYFGKGKGGTVEDNMERWIKQMSMPDGRDPHTAVLRHTKTVDGMKAHVLSLYGIYNAPVGNPMEGKTTPKTSYRLVGVVVEAPEGNVFFKLTGPEYTARIMIEAFMAMIEKIKKTAKG